MQRLTVKEQITRKLELMETINDNSEKLRRFIPKQNMMGIKRVLNETNQLIEALCAVDKELAEQVDWQQFPHELRQALTRQKATMLQSYQQAIAETVAVHREIAGKLRGIRNSRQLKNSYSPWNPRPGRRLSIKG